MKDYDRTSLIIGAIVLFIACVGVLYVIASLAEMSFDPSTWTPAVRYMTFVMIFFTGALLQQQFKGLDQ